MTQKQMAVALEVSFASVNGWENGRHEPMPLLKKQIRKMAIELGIDPDDPSAGSSSERSKMQPGNCS